MRYFLATGNPHKLKEVEAILRVLGSTIRIEAADEIGGMPEVEEGKASFVENARIKARALFPGVPEGAAVIADDSGLCVDFLDGEPGVCSSRYAGEHASDAENVAHLLARLEGVEAGGRGAHFICVLVLLEPGGGESVFEGRCHGSIALRASGRGGFGYDPVFIPSGRTLTFASLTADEKNRISHRTAALRLLDLFSEKSVSLGPDSGSPR